MRFVVGFRDADFNLLYQDKQQIHGLVALSNARDQDGNVLDRHRYVCCRFGVAVFWASKRRCTKALLPLVPHTRRVHDDHNEFIGPWGSMGSYDDCGSM